MRPLVASSGGLVTPYNHGVTPHGSSLRQEYYVSLADCCVLSKDECSSFLLGYVIGLIDKPGYLAAIEHLR
jgi:hypothetical protein